uniref:Endonuclease/exonuclease/phosphatase domain-containing protein n=1 Tax=Equus caballus TaxID=9796 RepID=A0A9L0R6D6_HORSE
QRPTAAKGRRAERLELPSEELEPGVPKFIKQLLTNLKEDIKNNTIIVGDLNAPLTPMDRSSREKINKEIVELNKKLKQLDLLDIYRSLHPKIAEYTFFSST